MKHFEQVNGRLTAAYQLLKEALNDPSYLNVWHSSLQDRLNKLQGVRLPAGRILELVFEHDAPPPASPAMLEAFAAQAPPKPDDEHVIRNLPLPGDTLATRAVCERCGKFSFHARNEDGTYERIPCTGVISNLDRVILERFLVGAST